MGCPLNFYPHHIGDYLTATAHLTWQEDCAYRRLLDVYYSREHALPTEIAQACRLVRAATKEERKAVETVLSEFFMLTPEGWMHSRCEAEIVKAREAADRARTNGKKGGRPAKTKPTGNPEETQPVISGNPEESKSQAPITNPITNTSYSVPIGTVGKPTMTPDEIIFGYGLGLLTNAGTPDKQARSFLGGLRKGHGDAALIDSLRECAKAKPLQPLEWLAAALPPAAIAGKPNRQEAIEQRNREAADRWAAQGENHAQH